MDELQEIYSSKEDDITTKTKNSLRQDRSSRSNQSLRRRAKQPEAPRWGHHSLVYKDGFMTTLEKTPGRGTLAAVAAVQLVARTCFADPNQFDCTRQCHDEPRRRFVLVA